MLGTTTIEGELLPKLVPDIVAGDTLVDVKQTFFKPPHQWRLCRCYTCHG